MAKLGKKGKLAIGAGVTLAGIGGILWAIFGGRKKGMDEDDYEIAEAEEIECSDSEDDTES